MMKRMCIIILRKVPLKNKMDQHNQKETLYYYTLKKFVEEGTQAGDKKCLECGDPECLIYEEGCLKCKNCGHTKCG